MLDSMFWGSRAPWGRSEDRCDGAGSEADGAKPRSNRAQCCPFRGFWFCMVRLLWWSFGAAVFG